MMGCESFERHQVLDIQPTASQTCDCGRFLEIPLVDAEGNPLNHPELKDLMYQCEEKAVSSPRTLELGWLKKLDRD
jgi:hypothetical protein